MQKQEEKKSFPIHFTKNNFLIIALLGILLLVIAWPVGKEKQKDKSATTLMNAVLPEADTVKRVSSVSEGGTSTTDMQAYIAYLEKTLENLLVTIEGAGRVKVMLTLKSSQEAIVEKDKTQERAGTTEVDSAGGSRNTTDIMDSEETMYTDGAGNGNVPYVKKILAPQIEGVVVSTQGGDNPKVVMSITDAIEVLFGIDAHKIKIVKMISK